MPPGRLIFTRKQHTDKVRTDITDYDPDNLSDPKIENIEDYFPYENSPAATWSDIKGVHDTILLSKVGEWFEVHPLVPEDILNASQRHRTEVFDNDIFFVIKMLPYNEAKKIVDSEQASLIIGSSYVISLQEKEEDIFEPLRGRLRKGKISAIFAWPLRPYYPDYRYSGNTLGYNSRA